MKSRSSVAPAAHGPERVAYISAQGLPNPKGRQSGRDVRQPGQGGFVLTGMYESLAKTFTTYQAAADYAIANGYKVRSTRPAPKQKKP